MYHFVFTSEINSVPPHQSPQKYPCFLCQVERFELFQHLEKYPEHAKGLSPEISQLYLNLMLIHDKEHQSNINRAEVRRKSTSRKQLSRLHPKSLFFFKLTRQWVENLLLIDAHLRITFLRRGISQI